MPMDRHIGELCWILQIAYIRLQSFRSQIQITIVIRNITSVITPLLGVGLHVIVNITYYKEFVRNSYFLPKQVRYGQVRYSTHVVRWRMDQKTQAVGLL